MDYKWITILILHHISIGFPSNHKYLFDTTPLSAKSNKKSTKKFNTQQLIKQKKNYPKSQARASTSILPTHHTLFVGTIVIMAVYARSPALHTHTSHRLNYAGQSFWSLTAQRARARSDLLPPRRALFAATRAMVPPFIPPSSFPSPPPAWCVSRTFFPLRLWFSFFFFSRWCHSA